MDCVIGQVTCEAAAGKTVWCWHLLAQADHVIPGTGSTFEEAWFGPTAELGHRKTFRLLFSTEQCWFSNLLVKSDSHHTSPLKNLVMVTCVEILIILEDNLGELLYYLEVGNVIWKAFNFRRKLSFIKIKNLCVTFDTRKIKTQATKWVMFQFSEPTKCHRKAPLRVPIHRYERIYRPNIS